jgi:hypothetical protein
MFLWPKGVRRFGNTGRGKKRTGIAKERLISPGEQSIQDLQAVVNAFEAFGKNTVFL